MTLTEYEVGPAFTAIIRSYLERSLIFNLVDEELRDEMIEEIKFSLSGLASGELETGGIKLAEYFLVGSVTELGADFRLTLQLVSVETGEVVGSAGKAIPKEEVFETSEAYTAAYVSPYGLGIEFGVIPWATTMGEMAQREGQPHPQEFNLFSIMLHYRIRKWLVAWGGLALAPGAVRFDKSYNEKGINLDAEDVENMGADLPEGSTITYSKDRSPYFSLHLGAGYVWNFSKTLNLTAGAELSMAQTFLEQEYTIPLDDTQMSYGTYTVTSNDISLYTIAPTLKVQYFVTPRVAFQFTYQFKYQMNKDTESTNYFFRDGSYGDGAPIPELYDLDPTVDPYGEKHITDMSGHTVNMGVGFYF